MSLDVRTKVLLVIFANMTFLFRGSSWFEGVLVLGLGALLALTGRPRMALGQLVFFGACLLVDAWLVAVWSPGWVQFPISLVRASRLMMPAILAGSLLLATSTAYELMHGLRQWRLPEPFLLTLAVMLRFLPMIGQDARTIRQSLRLRGLFLHKRDVFLHPLQYGEYLLVPLLMALLRRVEELTMALMTKGLALDVKASQTFARSFSWLDWSVCLWLVGMTTWLLL